MFGRLLFQALLFYIGYRFIFNFLVPVVRTTLQLRKQAKKFQDQVRQNASRQEEPVKKSAANPNKPSAKGDYIDFEELN
jgi:hypothetical protein